MYNILDLGATVANVSACIGNVRMDYPYIRGNSYAENPQIVRRCRGRRITRRLLNV